MNISLTPTQAETLRIALELLMREVSLTHQSIGNQIALQSGRVESASEEPKAED